MLLELWPLYYIPFENLGILNLLACLSKTIWASALKLSWLGMISTFEQIL